MFRDKSLEAIGRADFDALVASRIKEDRFLEYKESLPERWPDSEVKEFVKDITAFANTGGGDILYGVAEERDENGRTTGVAGSIPGIVLPNPEVALRALEQRIRSGTEPTLSGVRFHTVLLEDGKLALVARVPQSWSQPHAVAIGESRRFYARGVSGSYLLSVPELRAAFLRSETIAENVRRFRFERIAQIGARATPVPVLLGPMLCMHFIPFTAFDLGRPQIDPTRLLALRSLQLGDQSLAQERFNADGTVVSLDAYTGETLAYAQGYRQGIVEFVDSRFADHQFIWGREFEREVVQVTRQVLDALRGLEVGFPVVILLSLFDVDGLPVRTPDPRRDRTTVIDRNPLLCPDILAESDATDIPALLRPAIDVVWNAAGWPRSPFYDAAGAWAL